MIAPFTLCYMHHMKGDGTAGISLKWDDVLDIVERSRPREATAGEAPGNQLPTPPDPGRTRRSCQALSGVINELPDDLMRRMLLVYMYIYMHIYIYSIETVLPG